MSLRSTAKRWTYLVHRWLGIGGCLLMLLWFVSGMVMLFIGYPKLTPGERLARCPLWPIRAAGRHFPCCRTPCDRSLSGSC